MTVLLSGVLKTIQSHLQASGYFETVTIGEPTDPPSGFHAAIMLSAYSHPETTLNGTIEHRDVNVRLYRKAFQGDTEAEATELAMDEAVAKIQEDFIGDFNFGAVIRNIRPTAMTTTFGYQTIGAIVYRLADILVPMIVDDSAVYSP